MAGKKKLPHIKTAFCDSVWTFVLMWKELLLDNNFFIDRAVVQNSFQRIDADGQT